MANVLAELFQNTADAIREKTGGTGTMKPAEFPDKIRGITTGGNTSENPFASYTLLESPQGIPEGAYIDNFTWHPNGKHMLITTTKGALLYDTTTEPYTFLGILDESDGTSVIACLPHKMTVTVEREDEP